MLNSDTIRRNLLAGCSAGAASAVGLSSLANSIVRAQSEKNREKIDKLQAKIASFDNMLQRSQYLTPSDRQKYEGYKQKLQRLESKAQDLASEPNRIREHKARDGENVSILGSSFSSPSSAASQPLPSSSVDHRQVVSALVTYCKEQEPFLTQPGIFRLSPNKAERDKVDLNNIEEYLRGNPDNNVLAVLIKSELEQALTKEDRDILAELAEKVNNNDGYVPRLDELPVILSLVIQLCQKVASYEASNLMGVSNLALLFAPRIIATKAYTSPAEMMVEQAMYERLLQRAISQYATTRV